LERVYSPINGEILVTENLFGKREMKVGEVSQSGGLVKKLWNSIFNLKSCLAADRFSIFNQFSKSNFKCLILGLGGGTLASLIVNRYPQTAKITGIEIDPKIIELGKKYLDLDEIKNLDIVIADAIKEISFPKFIIRNTKYNLILVDLYLGQEFPKEAESNEFLNSLKSILEKDGLIIFNRLNFGKHKKETAQFKEKIAQFFPYLISREVDYNLLVFAFLEAQKKVYC